MFRYDILILNNCLEDILPWGGMPGGSLLELREMHNFFISKNIFTSCCNYCLAYNVG